MFHVKHEHDIVSHLRHIVAPCIFFLTCTFWSHLNYFLVIRIILWYHFNITIQEKYMSTKDTLELIKELFQMIKLNKQYIDLLEKRISLLEKSNG